MIPLINLGSDPTRELDVHHGVDDIGHPLLGQLIPLPFIWQVDEQCRIASDEGLDLLHREAFVLGNLDVLDIAGLDLLPGSGDEILQETGKELEFEMLTY